MITVLLTVAAFSFNLMPQSPKLSKIAQLLSI